MRTQDGLARVSMVGRCARVPGPYRMPLSPMTTLWEPRQIGRAAEYLGDHSKIVGKVPVFECPAECYWVQAGWITLRCGRR